MAKKRPRTGAVITVGQLPFFGIFLRSADCEPVKKNFATKLCHLSQVSAAFPQNEYSRLSLKDRRERILICRPLQQRPSA